MMKRYFIVLMTLISVCFCVSASDNAQQTLDKCVAKLKGASGITADFTITRQGKSISGKIKEKGNKFAIITSSLGTWYDGMSLTTWQADSNEATIVSPGNDELSDTNPLLLLQSATSYNVSYGATKNNTQKVLVLTPKRRGLSAKKIVVTLSAASLTPQRIDVTMADGKNMVITLRNVSLKASIAESEFKFNKSKYPKVSIVDLR